MTINRGILTGFNDAFIIDTATKDEILNNCVTEEERQRTENIIKPILRGRDIKRYSYTWAGLWIINTHNGLKSKGLAPINIKDYPAVKEHLSKYWDQIKNRYDKGDTPYNLRNCKYLDDFEKDKIMWKAVGRNLAFSIVEPGVYLSAPACFIVPENIKYVLGVLCSKFAQYFIYQNSDTTGAGDIMLNIQSLVKIPIPKVTDENRGIVTEIEALVDKITEGKKALEEMSKSPTVNPDDLKMKEKALQTIENIIDKKVYDLYSLTPEEIDLIENS